MPYRWSTDSTDSQTRRLEIWPHRSLPRAGFAAFILATFTLLCMPLFIFLGTVILWELLPFLMFALGGLWWGLESSYRSARLHEVLTIGPENVHLTRVEANGTSRDWDCNRYWAKLALYPSGGPVSDYVTLRGSGREVEIGMFLSEDERRALYADLCDALPPPPPMAAS